MNDDDFQRCISRTLDDACDMNRPQVGRLSGLMLSLHGVTAETVAAMWMELSKPDRVELATRVLRLVAES